MITSNHPKLLLHICCGPCATTVIEALRDNYTITGYFFNPNIYPEFEYQRRKTAAAEVSSQMDIPFIEGPYEPVRYFQAVKGFENEPENGARCGICYRLRLSGTAKYAVANGFSAIASTLTTGPQKKAAIINPVGEEAAVRAGVVFVPGDWKKKDGYRRSCELSREFGLYRQHYCGCRFSIPAHEH